MQRLEFLKKTSTVLASGIIVPNVELVPEPIKRFWSLWTPKGVEHCYPCRITSQITNHKTYTEFIGGHIDIRPLLEEHKFDMLNREIGEAVGPNGETTQEIIAAADNSSAFTRDERIILLTAAGHTFPDSEYEKAKKSVDLAFYSTF